ncbi:MAG: hypothetical protein ABS951_03735 [Solibacillus sp.]
MNRKIFEEEVHHLDIINMQKIIYDSSLNMAIIAINMTIIGLTSLADFKKVIGVDYGTFLMKKYKLVCRFTVYHVLILFAVVNVSSLFLMFVDNYTFRIINFILLILSLIFAIYYFFTFIIVDNKSVRKQIYQMELEGSYIHSNNEKHHDADELTRMNSGSSCPKKISSNLVEFFNTYNDETQKTFQEIFGPTSLLYDDSKKRQKRYQKMHGAKPYIYRKEASSIADISFEFLQFLRTNQIADKWALEILRLMDGKNSDHYEILRLYNFTRLMAQINLFISTGAIYQYKFLQHLEPFYYKAVQFDGDDAMKVHVLEVEEYAFRQLLQLMYSKNDCKDLLFYQFAEEWLLQMIRTDTYKGLLSKDKMISIMLKKVHKYDTPEYKKTFTEVLSAYYAVSNNVPPELCLSEVKEYIKNKPLENTAYEKISQKELFESEVAIVSSMH